MIDGIDVIITIYMAPVAIQLPRTSSSRHGNRARAKATPHERDQARQNSHRAAVTSTVHQRGRLGCVDTRTAI